MLLTKTAQAGSGPTAPQLIITEPLQASSSRILIAFLKPSFDAILLRLCCFMVVMSGPTLSNPNLQAVCIQISSVSAPVFVVWNPECVTLSSLCETGKGKRLAALFGLFLQ